MKSFLALLLCSSLWIGCQPAEKSASASAHPASELADSLQMLTFDAKNLLAAYPRTDSLLGGARWKDASEENTLVISQRISSLENDEVMLQEIFARLYVREGEKDSLRWQWMEKGMSMCDPGEGLVSEVKVADLSQDGHAEAWFVVNAQSACDVAPVDFFLAMQSRGQTYSIRGTNTIVQDGQTTGGEKQFDARWPSAPSAFKTAASELWGQTLAKFRLAPEAHVQ